MRVCTTPNALYFFSKLLNNNIYSYFIVSLNYGISLFMANVLHIEACMRV